MRRCREEAIGVTLVAGPLAAGWPTSRPLRSYPDRGRRSGNTPRSWLLKRTRNLAASLLRFAAKGRITQAVIAEVTPFGVGISPLYDCATYPIPSLRKAPFFAF